jgi:hypothetical protein
MRIDLWSTNIPFKREYQYQVRTVYSTHTVCMVRTNIVLIFFLQIGCVQGTRGIHTWYQTQKMLFFSSVFLLRKSKTYNEGTTKIYDIGGDEWDLFNRVDIFELTSIWTRGRSFWANCYLILIFFCFHLNNLNQGCQNLIFTSTHYK